MTATLVNSTSAGSGAGNPVANSFYSLGFSGTAGNTLLVYVFEEGSATITGMTDSAGNTYVRDLYDGVTTGNGRSIYRCSNFTGSPNTIKFTAPSNVGVYFSAFEVSGLSNSSPLDAAVANTSNNATISYTTTAADDFALIGITFGGSPGTVTPSSGYSLITHTAYGRDSAYGIDTGAAGAQSATITSSSSTYLVVAAYKIGAAVNPTYSLGDVSVDHAAGTATVPVTLSSGAPAGGFSVNWQTADGTATAPSYYTASSGTVNIAAGQTTGSIVIPIIP